MEWQGIEWAWEYARGYGPNGTTDDSVPVLVCHVRYGIRDDKGREIGGSMRVAKNPVRGGFLGNCIATRDGLPYGATRASYESGNAQTDAEAVERCKDVAWARMNAQRARYQKMAGL